GSDLLLRHGGHSMAAGVALAAKNLDPFRERLDSIVRRSLRPDQLQPSLRLDAEVGLPDVTLGTARALNRLKPVGQGNPAIQLLSRNLVHDRPLQRVGSNKQHVKMWVSDGKASREAIWWRAGEESLPVGSFDLDFAPQLDLCSGNQ